MILNMKLNNSQIGTLIRFLDGENMAGIIRNCYEPDGECVCCELLAPSKATMFEGESPAFYLCSDCQKKLRQRLFQVRFDACVFQQPS